MPWSLSGNIRGPAGVGGATTKMVEFDCGNVAKRQHSATVTDAAILATSKLVVVQAGEAATGHTADENELEQFTSNAIPQAGKMVVNLAAVWGCSLQGPVRIYYTVG